MINSKHSQSGNVLFLILIAVALFAALSYAVINSNRGNGKTTTEDEMNIDSARVVQDCAILRQAVLRFMATSDLTVDQIQLHDAAGPWEPCRTGANCLFAKEGGGAIIPIPPNRVGAKGAATPYQMWYEFAQISDNEYLAGYASNKPLLMFSARSLSAPFCEKLNLAVGRPATGDAVNTSNPDFRDACVVDTGEIYFRCPLTR